MIGEECYNCKYFEFVFVKGRHGERSIPYCHKKRVNVDSISFPCDSYQSREVRNTYGMVKEDKDET